MARVTVKEDKLLTVIVTGLSGSGKSVALNSFEDNGFFCVDNLPTTLIGQFIELCNKTPAIKGVAIGADIRERKFLTNFPDIISSLRKNYKVEVLFLEAKDDVLIRRFKETRRPHPLGNKDIKDALRKEARLLSGIRKIADRVIDTSSLNPHQLRRLITMEYSGKRAKKMNITLISFGYKYGIPLESDLLFDVRFLPNPNFIEELKRYSGRSKRIRDFLLKQRDTKQFLNEVNAMLDHLIPLYIQEGRSYLTIGIGCTGGRHRSPAIVEEVKNFLKQKGFDVSVVHRDLHEGWHK
ncbi:MAG: RNase adapter RapZ [Thermodesulfovibrionia bacterium]